jgi:pimeloyl-ACP methyl ester carboxylesterase
MMMRMALALLLLACAPSFARDDGNRFAATLVAAERFDIGATLVERHGQRGTPVILVPDLAAGAWSWQSTIAQLKGEHVVYALTLPGFDGRPAVAGQGLAAAQDALRVLIESRKLGKAVLIGHGLGGTLALQLAAQHPELAAGVVSIDGLPLVPGTEDWTPMQRTQMINAIANRKQAPFARQQQYMRGTGVIDMARADELAKLAAKSDPAAVSGYLAEALALDVRAALPAIKAPVLLMAPYFDLDGEQQEMTQASRIEYYRSLMKGTPDLSVVAISPARHYAMFDQPQQVGEAIRAFLAQLSR